MVNQKFHLELLIGFVTNYSKKNNIMMNGVNKTSIFIYLDYKSQLKAYSKNNLILL